MKFAHDYTQILNAEDYPSQWVQSAISYKRLKKCIKKVRKELLSLGLRPEILNLLWHQSQAANAAGYDGAGGDSRPFGFQYSLSSKFLIVLSYDIALWVWLFDYFSQKAL